MEIRTNGVVNEALTHLGGVSRLVAKDDVVVPSTFGFKVGAPAGAPVGQVQQRVPGGDFIRTRVFFGGSLLGGFFSRLFRALGFDALEFGE